MDLLQSIGSLMPYAGDAFNAVTGLLSASSAGDIGRAKKKLVDTQINYNKKQIQETLKKDYANTLSKYATERNNVVMQRFQADSNLRSQLAQQNNGAIDINESSFRGTAYGQLDKEFSEAMDQIRENNKNNMLSLTSKATQQNMEQDLLRSKSHLQINQETEQEKSKAFQQVAQAGLNMFNTYLDAKADEDEQNKTNQNIQAMKGEAMTGSEYYKNKNNGWGTGIKSNSGWGSAMKQNQGGYLQLNYFNSKV